jgi:hypothetical protein
VTLPSTPSALSQTELRGPVGAKPNYDVFAYAPRRLAAGAPLEVRGFTIKPYLVAVDDAGLRLAARHDFSHLLDLALPRHDDANFHGPGFAVLHQGRDGVYLLAATWYAGHNLTSSTHLVRPGEPAQLEKLPHDLFACVWELGVYHFEREAWMRTTMFGRGADGFDDYLRARCEGWL